MTTLIEKSILNERLEKSRSGIYADTSENRRKHRVGQKYGSEKKEEEKPEKTDPNKMSPEQQLEAINKVIAAIKEGKLKLPPEEINTLLAKKTMAEEAVKQAKGEKKPEEKEESKKEATKPETKAEAAASLSPMLKQYYDLKAKYPNALLLCRSGDFYHTYSNDAEKAAKILGITLTRSNRTKDIEGKPLGMAGFPSHALGIYLPKLIRAGERVAIYDQIEAPKERTRDEKTKEIEAQEEPKKEATKPEAKSEGKQYATMDIKEAKKELVGKKITFKEYFFDGVDSYKDAEGEIKKVRLYGKEKQPIAEIDFPNGDGITISLEQLDKRKAMQYEIEFNDSKSEEPKQEASGQASDPIYQVQQKKKEASKKYDSKREEARQKYDKEADEIRSEIDKLYESDHPDAAKKRKELWNTLKEKTNKYDAETTRLKDEYEAEYKKLDEAEDKLYDQRQKEETSEEVKESYTRVKFEDVPNSGKVNLKKYLSEKVRQGVDEKWSNIKNIPTDNLKKMEKGLVNDLNKNFEAIKKSQRAELLYSIMKVKGELEKRKQEEIKKYQKYTSSLDDNTLLSIGYDLGEEIRKLSSRGFSTLEQQEEVLKKISELSVKRQINEDEQRKRMDKLNNLPDETRANKKGELAKRGNESQKKE